MMADSSRPPTPDLPADRQRIDKWLWFARMARTRAAAARLVTDGHVRLNGRRVEATAKQVGPGDVVTLALERQVRVLRVLSSGLRREGYPQAQTLYEDVAASD